MGSITESLLSVPVGRTVLSSWRMAKVAFDELRFVVADDNAHMRRIVRTLLRAFGCREIYEAEDGASGLEAVEAYSPDILLTDITMPIFDGIELTRMIRNPEGCRHPFLPIIVLSAYSEKKHVIAAPPIITQLTAR